jgi:hypothetical protein
MTRKLLFAAILCACLPQEAFSQAESVAEDANPPCCGQSGSLRLVATPVKGFAGAAPSRSVTRQNVEKILLRQTKATQLTSGVHVVSRSPQGYKLMATVSQQGRADSWYVLDPTSMQSTIHSTTGHVSNGPGQRGSIAWVVRV